MYYNCLSLFHKYARLLFYEWQILSWNIPELLLINEGRTLVNNRNKKETRKAHLGVSISIVAWTCGYNTTEQHFPRCSCTRYYFHRTRQEERHIQSDHDSASGDIVTIVSVNGESRVKLFDDSKTYIHSIKADDTDDTGGLIEYVATFPNMTVNSGDEYKVCALMVKDSSLICETGINSPALRPESKDLYIQEGKPTTSQAAKISGEE
jgi:hypothetical protein